MSPDNKNGATGEIKHDKQPLASKVARRDDPEGLDIRREAFKVFAEERRNDLEKAVERRVATKSRRRISESDE
jgi:trehalose-6-phosphate synthase